MDSSEMDLHFGATGFLINASLWNEELAAAIAKRDGIGPLDEVHWQIIRHLRHSWLDHHALPAVSHVCHRVGKEPHCLDTLFNGLREAWRVAGLPDPGEEARAYM